MASKRPLNGENSAEEPETKRDRRGEEVNTKQGNGLAEKNDGDISSTSITARHSLNSEIISVRVKTEPTDDLFDVNSFKFSEKLKDLAISFKIEVECDDDRTPEQPQTTVHSPKEPHQGTSPLDSTTPWSPPKSTKSFKTLQKQPQDSSNVDSKLISSPQSDFPCGPTSERQPAMSPGLQKSPASHQHPSKTQFDREKPNCLPGSPTELHSTNCQSQQPTTPQKIDTELSKSIQLENNSPAWVQTDPPQSSQEVEPIKSSERNHFETINFENPAAHDDIVQLITDTNYWHNRTSVVENAIVRRGRPMPLLTSSSGMDLKQNNSDGFWADEKVYREIPWLTGSTKGSKYLCWPCLLNTEQQWCIPAGMKTTRSLEAIECHKRNSLHLLASKALQYQEANLKLKALKIADPQKNELVRAKRGFLSLLVRILCFKKSKQHNTDGNFDGFEELMKVAMSYNTELEKSFKKLCAEDGLIDFVSAHAQKLLKSVELSVKAMIRKEIDNVPFVSIVYEDTENVVDQNTQIAVIVRFVTTKGVIRERFLKLVRMGVSRRSEDFLRIHCGILQEFGIEDKLVGISYSGTVVSPCGIANFNRCVRSMSNKSEYVHYPNHQLKELLLQSLTHVENCRYFFQVIAELVGFFANNSGAIPSLIAFIKTSDLNSLTATDPYTFSVGMIQMVRNSYTLFLQFFDRVSKKFWNDEVAQQAPIFLKFLRDSRNRFMIAVTAAVLETVEGLSKVVDRGYLAAEWRTESVQALSKLKEIKENGVTTFLYAASDPNMSSTADSFIDPKIPKDSNDTFMQIIETAMNFIVQRCLNVSNSLSTSVLSGKLTDVIQNSSIWRRYGPKKEELTVLNRQMDFINANELHKTVLECIQSLSATDKRSEFPDWHKFLSFCALTLPPERSVSHSTVVKLKSYLEEKQKFKSAEVLMYLERDLIRSLLKTTQFFDDVITHYATINNEPSFLYDETEEL